VTFAFFITFKPFSISVLMPNVTHFFFFQMGYSYAQDDAPLMCFNAAKMSQLGWYTDMEAVMIPASGEGFTGRLIGSTDYAVARDALVDYKVILRIASNEGNDYFLTLNWAEDYNLGTRELPNKVTIVRGGDRISSLLIAGLGEHESHVIPNFDGMTRDLEIKTYSIGTAHGDIDYMQIEVSISCNNDIQCSDHDSCNGIESCVMGQCLTGVSTLPSNETCLCGNGHCDAGEDCANCPSDCADGCSRPETPKQEDETPKVDDNGGNGIMFNIDAKALLVLTLYYIMAVSLAMVMG
jgi:hypothetical protein